MHHFQNPLRFVPANNHTPKVIVMHVYKHVHVHVQVGGEIGKKN